MVRTSRHDLLVGYNPPLSDRTPEKKLGGKNQVVQSLGINGKNNIGKEKKTQGKGQLLKKHLNFTVKKIQHYPWSFAESRLRFL